jgi:hypothetical protein
MVGRKEKSAITSFNSMYLFSLEKDRKLELFQSNLGVVRLFSTGWEACIVRDEEINTIKDEAGWWTVVWWEQWDGSALNLGLHF